MVKAYVLITVDTTMTQDVVGRLSRIPGVVEVNEVLGPYDVVAELEVERLEDVTDILRTEIRRIPGVRNTLTCVSIRP